jgi:hypothetical protein
MNPDRFIACSVRALEMQHPPRDRVAIDSACSRVLTSNSDICQWKGCSDGSGTEYGLCGKRTYIEIIQLVGICY